MSGVSELSVSLSSMGMSSEPSLNDTRDIMQFYSKNNITLNALKATYDLIGKNKSKYFVKKDIKLHSELDFKIYIRCVKCDMYQDFKDSAKKKICYSCLSYLKPVETNFFVYIPINIQIRNALSMHFENIVTYHEEMKNKNDENINDIHQGSIYTSLLEGNTANNVIPLPYLFNTDGIQVFNKGSDSLWPIQLVL